MVDILQPRLWIVIAQVGLRTPLSRSSVEKEFVLSNPVREERRRINERCLWCFAESNAAQFGTILNESATGILLQTEETLDEGKRIWVLSLPGEDPSNYSLPPEDLINHPLSRAGTIVRQENQNRSGIQFDKEANINHPQYQRWYRGKSSIVTLIDKERAVIHLDGSLTFEGAVLLERLLTKQSKSFREILFSCHKIERINGTALTVLRSALRHCDKNGIVLTVIAGPETYPALEKNPILEVGYTLNLDSPPPQIEQKPSSVSNQDTPTNVAHSECVLILTRGIAGLSRLSMPFDRLGIPIVKTQNFKEAPELIAANNPRFVIVDVELEHCPLLIDINKVRNYSISKLPPAMVIAPPHLGELIKEALALPVRKYLTKPCTDREYASCIQMMLTGETVTNDA